MASMLVCEILVHIKNIPGEES